MNLEELKRPLDEIAESLEFQLARNLDLPTRVALAANQSRIESALAALPAILAKLEAAQNEREQLNEQLRKMGADWLATAINGAAESLPVARIRGLVEQHGSYRKVGELLGVDHAYLHRIVSGEKDNMSDDLLRKIGLRRGTFYAAFDKEQQ